VLEVQRSLDTNVSTSRCQLARERDKEPCLIARDSR
jgi:hypothetical protein